ncbi:hypothetical protein [Streptomyces sp. NPDC002564]|uniref:hypothetical protein n=1 Tax=Streptomyces sp. NPDC002564 TaxID=3364649 RepID=UPI0036808559
MGERRREGGRGDAEEAARLRAELRALGRSMDAGGAGAETMAERVLARIIAEQAPVPVAERPGPGERLRGLRRGLRMRWRTVTAGLCGLLTVLALTPPVRAAVVDWFDFGGVEVRYDPSATPSAGPGGRGCGDPVSAARARRLAGFAPVVPRSLGTPDALSVTRGPDAHVLLTLCWYEDGGTIRLDEFPALLDPGVAKTVPRLPEWVGIDGGTGLWFARPHRLTFWLEQEDGDRWRRSERTAGPTLLWTRGTDLTLRLEGVPSKERAVEIARSVPERSAP